MALDGDKLIHVPAFAIDALDTTGAGDVFRGGFIYGYFQGWPLEDNPACSGKWRPPPPGAGGRSACKNENSKLTPAANKWPACPSVG
jgi:hypothetical protein